MALPALATADDLTARGVDVTNTVLVASMLAVASAEIRGAAGSPIQETTSTVMLTGRFGEQYLRLPGPPVQEVTAVLVDGIAVTDWRLDDSRLWRHCGWGVDCGPTPVTVTYLHGLPEVPDDLVDLVCSFAAAGIKAAEGAGYGAYPGLVAEMDGDYSVTYQRGAEAVATVMQVPPATRRMLRARFGASAGMVSHR